MKKQFLLFSSLCLVLAACDNTSRTKTTTERTTTKERTPGPTGEMENRAEMNQGMTGNNVNPE